MEQERIRVLLIEDNPGDIRFIKEILAEAEISRIHQSQMPLFHLSAVEKLSTALEMLSQKEWDVLLLDMSLPDSRGLETFTKVYDRAPNIPIIILTGIDDDTISYQVMSHQAQDYLIKGDVDSKSLVRSIRHAIERKRTEETIKYTQKQLVRKTKLLEAINQVFWEAFKCENVDTLAEKCLDVAKKLTGSKCGFLGELNQDGRLDTLGMKSPDGFSCKIPYSSIRDMEIVGIWGSVIQDQKSILTNDPGHHPNRVGTPEGHPPIANFLGVPLKQAGKTVGMVALANKENGYTVADQEDAEALSIAIVEALMRKKSEKELEKHREHLEELIQERTAKLKKSEEDALSANKAKSKFLANMSHEIRTPLNAILGFSQLMARDPTLTPQQKQHLDSINRSGTHLLALINDILEMAKIEAGHIALNTTTFDIHSLLSDMEMMFRVRTDEKNLSFIVERDSDLPKYITADAGKLRQILINLLGNAVKFTEKGYVKLRAFTRRKETRQFLLSTEIEDTGTGISETEMPLLFRPFVQTETGRRNRSGTGLGLAISMKFARLMGGNLSVKSEPGKGSTFCLEIPIEEAINTSVSQPQNQYKRVVGLKPGQGTVRVLVVDDEEENRVPLCQILKLVGFETKEATNGKEAIANFEQWYPHIIMMDLRMPVMDGYEAIRHIKATEQGKKTVIIVLTASVFAENKDIIAKIGADNYMRKPFQEQEIFGSIAQCSGIQYLYADEEKTDNRNTESANKKNPMPEESIALLPPSLVKEMHQAIVNADIQQFLDLVEKIEPNSQMAQKLKELAQNYDYETLIKILEPRL